MANPRIQEIRNELKLMAAHSAELTEELRALVAKHRTIRPHDPYRCRKCKRRIYFVRVKVNFFGNLVDSTRAIHDTDPTLSPPVVISASYASRLAGKLACKCKGE